MTEQAGDIENCRHTSIDRLVRRHHGRPDALIEILHAAQQEFGHLDRDLLGYLADRLKLPPSLVYGVAGFYHAFRLEPPGEHQCTVCIGTSCHIKGGTVLLRELERRFGVSAGKTTLDGSLSLNSVRCMGTCGLAPLAVFDGDTLSRATPGEQADDVCRRFEETTGIKEGIR